MEQVSDVKNKIIGTASDNPAILLMIVGALIVIIIAMYFGLFSSKEGAGKPKQVSDKAAPGSTIDKLIDEIHNKQKD